MLSLAKDSILLRIALFCIVTFASLSICPDRWQYVPTTDIPLAHLYGPSSGIIQQYNNGTVITNWHTGTGQWYSPILRAGMTYSNGYITVPTQGVYYVYGQLYYNPSSSTQCGFYFEVGGKVILYSYESKIGSAEWRSQHAGQVKTLNKGDKLVMKIQASCRYYFDYDHSLFGTFLL